MGCWTCLPTCDKCKPKFYECPECGGQGSFFFRKCLACGRAMTEEDEARGREEWVEKRRGGA
ncbi:MAG: hypothetical protein IJO87_07785 [Eggerthellaceae bacterium]|nr:hypothetical protein [Eggerthellaceae bacterium]